jgi:hypothetical protein
MRFKAFKDIKKIKKTKAEEKKVKTLFSYDFLENFAPMSSTKWTAVFPVKCLEGKVL